MGLEIKNDKLIRRVKRIRKSLVKYLKGRATSCRAKNTEIFKVVKVIRNEE